MYNKIIETYLKSKSYHGYRTLTMVEQEIIWIELLQYVATYLSQ